MKLALIRRQSAATGGAELYVQRLLEALVGAGHDVHLLAERWDAVPAGARLHAIEVAGGRATRATRFADAVERALAGAAYDCVFSLERTRRQDVYRAGDGVHRVWLERRRQFAPWWRRPWIGRGAFHRALCRLEAETLSPSHTRHVIVNSDMVRREIRRHFDFPPERLHLVRNGVHLERFQRGERAATRARFGVQDDEFLLLFVGSGWERKGLRFLLRALETLLLQRLNEALTARLGSWTGAEVPRGSMERKFKLLVVGQGRRPWPVPAFVRFAGPMAAVEDAYAAADLFVFLPIYEPSANVCFEALAAGLPVVTTSLNGASEVLEEGVTGTVVADPRDGGAVAEAVWYWWARRLFRPARDLTALSLERNVAETLEVLAAAAAEPRAAGSTHATS